MKSLRFLAVLMLASTSALVTQVADSQAQIEGYHSPLFAQSRVANSKTLIPIKIYIDEWNAQVGWSRDFTITTANPGNFFFWSPNNNNIGYIIADTDSDEPLCITSQGNTSPLKLSQLEKGSTNQLWRLTKPSRQTVEDQAGSIFLENSLTHDSEYDHVFSIQHKGKTILLWNYLPNSPNKADQRFRWAKIHYPNWVKTSIKVPR